MLTAKLYGGRQGPVKTASIHALCPVVLRPIEFRHAGVFYERYELRRDYRYVYAGLERPCPLYGTQKKNPLS